MKKLQRFSFGISEIPNGKFLFREGSHKRTGDHPNSRMSIFSFSGGSSERQKVHTESDLKGAIIDTFLAVRKVISSSGFHPSLTKRILQALENCETAEQMSDNLSGLIH